MVVTVASLVFVQACGGDDADTESAPSTTGAPDTTTTPDTTTPDTAPPDTTTPDTTTPGTAAPDTTTPDTAPPDTAAPETTTPDSTSPDTTPPDATTPDGSAELERRQIVALGEESVLADLLALGIEPIASSATVDTVGFQGIPDYDTSDIEVLPVTTLSAEYVASLRPEMIIAYQFLVDVVGLDVLEGMAETVVLPTGVTSDQQITIIGEAVDRADRAVELVDELDRELTAGADEVADDCTVSVAAIYPGPSVAAFVDGPWAIPDTVLSLGCALDPDTDDAEPDGNGRAYLSLEQITILDAPQMILMQSESVEGEQQSIDEITSDPIWQQLPAVQADAVDVLDRLGYPGIEGRIRLVGDLTAILP